MPNPSSLERARKWLIASTNPDHADASNFVCADNAAASLAAEFDAVREECAKIADTFEAPWAQGLLNRVSAAIRGNSQKSPRGENDAASGA